MPRRDGTEALKVRTRHGLGHRSEASSQARQPGTGNMHISACAQQTAVASSFPFHCLASSPSRRSSLFRRACDFEYQLGQRVSKRGLLASVAGVTPGHQRVRSELRLQTVCGPSRSESRLSTVLLSRGESSSPRSRRSASRYGRDGPVDDGEFSDADPDIASLRTGFAKKFPGKDPPDFLFDFDSDDEEDDEGAGGRVASGAYRRVPSPRSPRTARDGYDARPELRGDKFSRPERPREPATGYDRRKVDTRIPAKTQGYIARRESKIGLEPSNYRSSGNDGERTAGNDGYSWKKERGNYESRSRSSSSGLREGASPVRNLKDGNSNPRNRGNLAARKAGDTRKTVRRGRAPYGGGEWSKDTPIFENVEKKKKPVIEEVKFTTHLNESPHVAILGGGMSGLMCALTLEKHGIRSTVFDTGQHGLGGRMGTRYVGVQNGEKLVFDHAAQFFTVTDTRFQKVVDQWISEGAVKEWGGTVGTLEAGGRYSELLEATRYVGTNGMRSLADHILSQSRQVTVKRPCWISRMMAADGYWKLSENRNRQGEFDIVVIAHNGKCANRLLSTARVPSVARQMKRLDLSSIWALLAAFEEPLLLPGGKSLDGAFVNGVESISWMGNNSQKLALLEGKSSHCWTFLSTAAYGKEHKVPQEGIPIPKAQRVTRDMLHGVEVAFGLPEGSLPAPFYSRLQLWGAALPVNTPGVPYIFDALGRVGVCGDWLVGSSIEAAALSGMELADHIANYRDFGKERMAEEFSFGLKESFAALKGHDIGQFSGTELQTTTSEALVTA